MRPNFFVSVFVSFISISNFGSRWTWCPWTCFGTTIPNGDSPYILEWYYIWECGVLSMKDWYLMQGWRCQANDVILNSVYLRLLKKALKCRYRIVARCWIYLKKLAQLIELPDSILKVLKISDCDFRRKMIEFINIFNFK